jgi:hypothetical protein
MAQSPQEPWIGTKWAAFAAAANRGLGGQGFVVHAAMQAARSNTRLAWTIVGLMLVQIGIAVVQVCPRIVAAALPLLGCGR